MKKFLVLSGALAGILLFSGCGSKGWKTIDGVIVVRHAGARAGPGIGAGAQDGSDGDGQVGFVGLGMRGPGAVERFPHLDGVEIKALCDLYPERVDSAQAILARRGFPEAAAYSGEEGLETALRARRHRPRLHRHPVAEARPDGGLRHEAGQARRCGGSRRHVARRVLAAGEHRREDPTPLHDARKLRLRLLRAHDAQHGQTGAVRRHPPCRGSYIHNLDAFWDYYEGNWRLDFNQKHRGDVYATHGLGPACQLLDIHRGDKMNYLVAVDPVGQRPETGRGEDGRHGVRQRRPHLDADQDRKGPHDPAGTQRLHAASLQPHVPADRYEGLRQQIPGSGLRLRSRTAHGVGRARPRGPEQSPLRAQGRCGRR